MNPENEHWLRDGTSPTWERNTLPNAFFLDGLFMAMTAIPVDSVKIRIIAYSVAGLYVLSLCQTLCLLPFCLLQSMSFCLSACLSVCPSVCIRSRSSKVLDGTGIEKTLGCMSWLGIKHSPS